MMKVDWNRVIPAITTPFNEDLSVDRGLQTEHAAWLVEHGCGGVVPFGSLGEGATLTYEEKIATVEALSDALGDHAPVVPMVAALSTAEAVRLAKGAAAAGASGFMVLPPYAYASDWPEMRSHVAAVLEATPLPCMLYNNPIAYKTDFLPEQVAQLVREHPNAEAIKESSSDLRRITELRVRLPSEFRILIGIDDLLVEAVGAGATGWIAGLANALPDESVRLFELALAGEDEAAFELYRWFLPLLRLDVGVKFVQGIKLAVEYAGWGSSRVRGPRQALTGRELDTAMRTIEEGFATRPSPPRGSESEVGES